MNLSSSKTCFSVLGELRNAAQSPVQAAPGFLSWRWHITFCVAGVFYSSSFAITDSYPTQAGRQSKRFRCQHLEAFCRKQFSYHKNVLGPLPKKPCLPLRHSPFPGLDSLLPSLPRHHYALKFPSPCSSHSVLQRFGGEKEQRVQQEFRVIQ